ncbi:hypothetical protein SPRG_04581 [Saprolegnia parasitica CBS 223.65]|uniref:tRNA-splicing endonuclease subunit Sen54 N-terminal domain-containing protein n=1 Tax=Saprolegnia parasitica (strain CBS 223.65) TaxID=695850 RepID=A0A067CNA3_SAPPC|nr:hypothetical protein SPRG_04581 [Saprolegnia parasitica CBS 223.65]KDO30680.1 hypothetical protein SPRG_04581 [Saprolegnia parasitica CBS 223.65]|eukprot:XP_012198384.1 hypothetical protein SPRG_04581 [Saprolegnia parasitica CBS 223.65]
MDYTALAATESNPVKTRSTGCLNVATGVTTVLQQRGKTLFHIGFHDGQRLCLHPEEAWCLAHRGVLDVTTVDSTTALPLRDVCAHLEKHTPRACREAYCFLRDRKFYPMRHERTTPPPISTADAIQIAYDVYAGKKMTPWPLFRVAVFAWDAAMPHAMALREAMGDDDVPWKLLVVDDEGSVLSYEIDGRRGQAHVY